MAEKGNSRFWEKARKPGQEYTPISEAKDPESLSPEEIIALKEELTQGGLSEDREEEIKKLLGAAGAGEEREAA